MSDTGKVKIHGELWKEIDKNYHVSNLGQVRSVRKWPGRILRPSKNPKTGYLTVHLGRHKVRYVHELVLLAFKGSRPGFMTASHLNGNRLDNRAVNLCWETSRENNARKIEHGTAQRGKKQGHARLTEIQARIIKSVKDPDWGWYTCIAKLYGVHPNTVRDVHQGRTWRHLHG